MSDWTEAVDMALAIDSNYCRLIAERDRLKESWAKDVKSLCDEISRLKAEVEKSDKRYEVLESQFMKISGLNIDAAMKNKSLWEQFNLWKEQAQDRDAWKAKYENEHASHTTDLASRDTEIAMLKAKAEKMAEALKTMLKEAELMQAYFSDQWEVVLHYNDVRPWIESVPQAKAALDEFERGNLE